MLQHGPQRPGQSHRSTSTSSWSSCLRGAVGHAQKEQWPIWRVTFITSISTCIHYINMYPHIISTYIQIYPHISTHIPTIHALRKQWKHHGIRCPRALSFPASARRGRLKKFDPGIDGLPFQVAEPFKDVDFWWLFDGIFVWTTSWVAWFVNLLQVMKCVIHFATQNLPFPNFQIEGQISRCYIKVWTLFIQKLRA